MVMVFMILVDKLITTECQDNYFWDILIHKIPEKYILILHSRKILKFSHAIPFKN